MEFLFILYLHKPLLTITLKKSCHFL